MLPLIDENVLRRLVRNPRAVQEFPFLTPPAPPPARPGCCGQPPAPEPDYNAIKAAIHGLPPGRQTALLGHAGMRAGRLVYWADGAVVDVNVGG